MHRRFKLRLTYANVTSTLALVAALAGGTAYASGLITGGQIAPHTITDRNIKAGGVGPTSLSAAARKLLRGAGQRGDTGAAGPAGPAGLDGAAGTQGATGLAGATGPQGATGTVDTSDFYDKLSSDARFTGHEAQLVRVAKSGGDFTTVTDALASISDNSFAKRYVVLVAPGTYAGHVVMKEYVDLVGAGANTTKLTDTARGATDATLVLADNSHVSDIAIDSSGGGSSTSIAVYSDNISYETVMRNVSITASNPGQTAIGVLCSTCYTRIEGGSVGVQNATTAKGVFAHGGGVHLVNLGITASGDASSFAVDTDSGVATVLDSVTATGNNSSVQSYALRLTNNPAVTVTRSDLDVMSSGGTWGAARVDGGTLTATDTTFEEWFTANPALSVAAGTTMYSRGDSFLAGVSVAGTFKSFGDMFASAPIGGGTKVCANALKNDWATPLSSACS